jgi:hypothetical protein
MQLPATARPFARPETEPEPAGLRRAVAWFLDRRLVIAAVLAWVFTIGAFALDHLTPIPQVAIVTLYALAYLSGGTDATRKALSDLFQGHVNVDLLMSSPRSAPPRSTPGPRAPSCSPSSRPPTRWSTTRSTAPATPSRR